MVLRKKIFWLNFLAMAFIAINLRAPITSIGPIVEYIQSHFGLNAAFVGTLTSLPLIAFGLFSFLVVQFHPIKAMIVGLLCIITGEIIRAYTEYIAYFLYIQDTVIVQVFGLCGLFIGTICMGAGIAVANVLLPSFIKSKFSNKVAFFMGIYSFILNTSAIIGIALALPLVRIMGLLHAMAFWAILAIAALLLYIPQTRNGRIQRISVKPKKSFCIYKNLNAWKIAAFMGIQSFMFYGIIVWLPKIIVEKGYNVDIATQITLISQCVAIPIALFGPILLTRLRAKYKPFYMAGLCSLYFISLTLLLLCDDSIILYIIAILLGMPMGGVFSIALLFISQKSSTLFISTKLSAMSQGCGYLIASLAPFLMGGLHDIFGSFAIGILTFAFMGFLLSILGLFAYRADIIEEI